MSLEIPRTAPANVGRVEEGVYNATLEAVELVQLGEYGDRVRWTFNIEGTRVSGLTSTTLNERSKMWRWIKGFGQNPEDTPVGEKIDIEKLVGKRCLVRVENRETRLGTEISNVVDVLPLPAKKKEEPKEEATVETYIKPVLTYIKKMQKTHKTVKYKEILDKFPELGEEKLKEVLGQLLSEGEIYEPRDGQYKAI